MSLANESGVSISVLVPVVERPDDLRDIHRSVLPEIEKLGRSFELLYLVSAEFEAAFQQARELHEQDGIRVRVLRFARPVSEAVALAAGFERARGEVIFTFPAYFDADPSGLPRLYEALETGADMAIASRTQRRDSLVKRAQTRWFNRLTSWATGTDFSDIASGTRALRREVVSDLPLYGDFHRFLPVLADRSGFSVQEIPVPQDARARAPRVYHIRYYLWRVLDILSIAFLSYFTRRPLRLFGAVGVLFGGLGALILFVVAVQRIAGEPAAGRSILILGTLLVGLGVQAFSVGLLGELLLFFQARHIRSYRIAEVVEAADPPLPETPTSDEN
jgi:glycosyltransferase involved in cell wall biosynthesis